MKHNTENETQNRASVEAGVIVKGSVIKLGMDVHARQITVCRQIGDCTPQPPQVFTKERLLVCGRKMIELGAIVHLDQRERALRSQLEAAASKELPRGIGALTWVVLARDERVARDGEARSEAQGEECRVPAQWAA